MSELCCPHCEYPLQGLRFRGDWLRCPECGKLTDLPTLASDLVALHAHRRRCFHSTMLCLGLAGAAIALSTATDGLPTPEFVGRRVTLLSTPLGITAVIYVAWLVFLATYVQWSSLWRRQRAFFAVVTTAILVAVPVPFNFLAVPAWWHGFHTWARHNTP